MVTEMSDKKVINLPVIRDKPFARRLETACEGNPHCPTVGRGKQKWLRESLADRFNITVSPEATRKWFAGESRPRPKVMSAVAQLLEVDEAWLSLGITPDETPVEKQKRNAVADGAVNYIAGLIQMAGGHIAFPEVADESSKVPDIYAIIRGKQFSIEVKRSVPSPNGEMTLHLPPQTENLIVIGVVDTGSPLQFDLLRIPQGIIEKNGNGRGGFIELSVKHGSGGYSSEGDPIPQILSFDNLDGIIPRGRRQEQA